MTKKKSPIPPTPPLLPPLVPEALRSPCDPAVLDFASTADLPDIDIGTLHPRAVEAMKLGFDIRHDGYNLFVLGDAGSGRHAIVERLLASERGAGEPPADWCYVNNFSEPSRSRLLRLPAGRGARLRDDMQRLVGELAPAIAAAFESEEYRSRVESMQDEEKQREEAALRGLGREAAQVGVALLRTPQGFVFAPMKTAEETLSPQEFEQLPEEKQREFRQHIEALHEQLHKLTNEFPRWRREMQGRIKEASRETLRLAIGHLIEELRPAYADLPEVGAHFDAVMLDIIESGESLREPGHGDDEGDAPIFSGSISVQRYLVNLLVGNEAGGGRPVVHEDHPTLQNLVGRVDHLVHMGTLVSNFTLIKAGALHRANGGFLILDAIKVLSQPYAWEGLKRALKSGEVRIESLSELIGLTSTLQLEPQPVPLDVKVVLIGERLTYYLLSEFDPEFGELFKIDADLDSEVERSTEVTRQYVRVVATLGRHLGLRPLTASAVAAVIEHAARLAADARRLATRTRPLADLMREADHFANGDAATIDRPHVEAALAARRRRHERIRLRYQEEILRGQLLVSTTGGHVGQVNGLAVIMLGEGTFAHPARITATVRLGEGEVIDIEREVELGGPIHSKGVLILSSFLAARFGYGTPLSLKASLVFEQSYGGVEGDSASLAELAALMSALAAVPVRQSLAVTGSVNQFGVVQPVGGINEKIEGFYDICTARGLTGEQGVLIPAPNVTHLMLRPDIVDAARAGRFAIWAVETVDQAMELLTGLPAGAPNERGEIPEGSINYQVAIRLAELARLRQDYSRAPRWAPRRRKAAARKKTPKPTPDGSGGG